MRLSTLLAVLLLVAAAIFSYQNQTLLYQEQTVQIPGGTMTLPLVGALLLAGVAAVILLWLADIAGAAAAAAGRRRAEDRLVQRERELADLKGRSYDEVGRKVDELSDQVTTLSKRIDEHWGAPAVAPAPPREPVGR